MGKYHILGTTVSAGDIVKSKDKTQNTKEQPFGTGMGTRQRRNKVNRKLKVSEQDFSLRFPAATAVTSSTATEPVARIPAPSLLSSLPASESS